MGIWLCLCPPHTDTCAGGSQILKKSSEVAPCPISPSGGTTRDIFYAKWDIVVAKWDIKSPNGLPLGKVHLVMSDLTYFASSSHFPPERIAHKLRIIINKNFNFLVILLFSYFQVP
jgi:hypothetical protein